MCDLVSVFHQTLTFCEGAGSARLSGQMITPVGKYASGPLLFSFTCRQEEFSNIYSNNEVTA